MSSSFSRARYIDSSGNEITRSAYESLLAHEILIHPEYWQDVFAKFDQKIIEILKNNGEGSFSYSMRMDDVMEFIERAYPGVTSKNKLIVALSGKGEVKTIYPSQFQFNFYKFFVERLLPVAQILPDSHLLDDKDNKYQDKPEIYYHPFVAMVEKWRPKELFSIYGRGRVDSDRGVSTPNPGISTDPATPSKLRNKFASSPIKPARLSYTRDSGSLTVQNMEKHETPFSSGPSGTLGYVICAFRILFNDKIKDEDYKKIYMALTAYLVYEGHHSFAELGLIIDAVKNIDPTAFTVDPTLDAKKYYDQFLTEAFRLSDAYHKFYTEYHPNKYSAMTWEILRDAIFEYKKNTYKVADSVIDKMEAFSKQRQDKHGELDVTDLDQFKSLLQSAKDEQSINLTRDKVVNKLIKKLEASGISLAPSQSIMRWGELREFLSNAFIETNLMDSMLVLSHFNYEHSKNRGELKPNDLAKLVDLIEAVISESNAKPDIVYSMQDAVIERIRQKLISAGVTLSVVPIDKKVFSTPATFFVTTGSTEVKSDASPKSSKLLSEVDELLGRLDILLDDYIFAGPYDDEFEFTLAAKESFRNLMAIKKAKQIPADFLDELLRLEQELMPGSLKENVNHVLKQIMKMRVMMAPVVPPRPG